MAIRSKKQQACVECYLAAHYDRVNVRWPKEFMACVRAQAEINQQSIAGYLRQAVEERMMREGVEPPKQKDENGIEQAEP